MKTKNVLVSILAGIAAGTVLGILIAPDKGSNTRKKIVSKSNEYISKMESQYNEFVDNLNSRFDSMKSELSASDGNGKPETKIAEAVASTTVK